MGDSTLKIYRGCGQTKNKCDGGCSELKGELKMLDKLNPPPPYKMLWCVEVTCERSVTYGYGSDMTQLLNPPHFLKLLI